jgi:hypothetical protein
MPKCEFQGYPRYNNKYCQYMLEWRTKKERRKQVQHTLAIINSINLRSKNTKIERSVNGNVLPQVCISYCGTFA